MTYSGAPVINILGTISSRPNFIERSGPLNSIATVYTVVTYGSTARNSFKYYPRRHRTGRALAIFTARAVTNLVTINMIRNIITLTNRQKASI